MASRPRTIFIGSDTSFVLPAFTNETTGLLITGITTGTLKLFSEIDSALIATLSLIELATEPGSYEAVVPSAQAELTEGLPVRLQFDLSGGVNLTLRLDARAVARVKKDDGL